MIVRLYSKDCVPIPVLKRIVFLSSSISNCKRMYHFMNINIIVSDNLIDFVELSSISKPSAHLSKENKRSATGLGNKKSAAGFVCGAPII